MRSSLQCFSFFLVLSLLFSCHGVGVRLDYDEDSTPLHVAIEAGYTEEARLLVQGGAAINSKDDFGFTPLHAAIETGDTEMVEVVRLLLENNAQVNSKDNSGNTPLHLAAGEGYTEEARLLLENNAQVNEKNNYGETPLHWAAKWDENGSAAGTLLAWGADVNIRNNRGHKPLDPGNSDFSPEAIFLVVAEAGRATLAEDILDSNRALYINTKDENGDTALILAARNGHLSVVEVLLRRGANKNRQNNDKQTALETSIRNRRRTVTLELINNNDRSLNALNSEGQTALMVAIAMGQKEVAFALIEAGTNLNLKDSRGRSALWESRNGNGKDRDLEKALLNNGAKEYDPVKIAATAAKVVAVEAAKIAVDKAI